LPHPCLSTYSGRHHSLLRIDKLYTYFDPGSGLWRIYNNNTPGNPYVNLRRIPGHVQLAAEYRRAARDHLIGSAGSVSARWKSIQPGHQRESCSAISNFHHRDVNATINAYAVEHPTALDVPIMTYRINSTQSAGLCAGLANGFNAPTPCNTAPWIGYREWQ